MTSTDQTERLCDAVMALDRRSMGGVEGSEAELREGEKILALSRIADALERFAANGEADRE